MEQLQNQSISDYRLQAPSAPYTAPPDRMSFEDSRDRRSSQTRVFISSPDMSKGKTRDVMVESSIKFGSLTRDPIKGGTDLLDRRFMPLISEVAEHIYESAEAIGAIGVGLDTRAQSRAVGAAARM